MNLLCKGYKMAKTRFDNINPVTLYTTVLPSTKKKVQYRAYNVREEKQLLLADESKDGIVMLKTLASIIEQCITPKQSRLTSFDVEYMFAKIRAKSVGEIATLRVGCDGPECADVSVEYRFNLDTLEVKFPENVSNIIKVSDTLGFELVYPSITDAIEIESEQNETKKKFLAISSSIVRVFNGDEILDVTDEDKEAIADLIDKLDPQQYAKLAEFFEQVPETSGKLEYRCPKCKKEHKKEIKGLHNFFS